MAKKMGNKFVALASVAVGVVYGAGYLVTQSAPIALAGQTNSPSATSNQGATGAVAASAPAQNSNTNGSNGTQGNGRHHHDGEDGGHGEGGAGGEGGSGYAGGSSSGSGSTSGTTSSSSSSSSSSASTASSPAGQSKSSSASSTQKYLDGTYSGSGSNRIGTVQVSVTIQSDKITNVQITGCYTHYPQDYIDPVLPQQVLAQQNTNIGYVSGATLSSMDFQDAVNQALQQAANPNYHGA